MFQDILFIIFMLSVLVAVFLLADHRRTKKYNDFIARNQRKPGEKWVSHIIGPDDVEEHPDELSALRAANDHNKSIVDFMKKEGWIPHDPLIIAVVKDAAKEEL